MLKSNSGFQALKSLVDHIRRLGEEATICQEWYDDRWGTIEAEMTRLVQNSVVDTFVNGYAASLVDVISDLLEAGEFAEAAGASIDFGEELLAQAEAVADATPSEAPVGATEEVQLDIDQIAVAANHSLAQAA